MLRRLFRKFFSLLTPAQGRTFLRLIALMAVGMLLEAVGLGLIVPLLAVMTGESRFAQSSAWQTVRHWLGDPSSAQLVVGGMLVIVAVFLLKNLFLYFLTWRQTAFFTNVGRDLTARLFARYLQMPYREFLTRNTGEMNAHLAEVRTYTLALGAFLNALAESMVVGGIFALLLYAEFWGTLIIGVVIGILLLPLHFTLRRYLARAGDERNRHQIELGKQTMQGLNGVKEIKLLDREEFFRARHAEHNTAAAAIDCRFGTVSQLPRLVLEVLAVAGLAGLISVMVWQENPMLVPVLGLFVGATFRLLPSVNRIIFNLQNLQFASAAIARLHAEITAPATAPTTVVATPLPALAKEISFERVSFAYPHRPAPVLRDVSLTIPIGAAAGFIGGSGAGKSTLIDLLVGLFAPTGGKILLDGAELTAENVAAWRRQIGYVPQTIYLLDDTLRRNIAFGLPDAAIDEAALRRAAALAQLADFIAELPAGLDTLIGERGARLSGGQRQRVGLARALYRSPTILILDEATSSLDLETERHFLAGLRQFAGKITTISVAHRLHTLAHCDRIFQLADGQIVADGTAREMLKERVES
ncbi:ABC transporter ATP-binding protein [Planctomycetales bacterium]|nr:ABC transporter ATP-binding protein [Planctomycetales bacterium]GHT06577.1 ABC transporter ATP-binding protein [Planctomycetales bacterium]